MLGVVGPAGEVGVTTVPSVGIGVVVAGAAVLPPEGCVCASIVSAVSVIRRTSENRRIKPPLHKPCSPRPRKLACRLDYSSVNWDASSSGRGGRPQDPTKRAYRLRAMAVSVVPLTIARPS